MNIEKLIAALAPVFAAGFAVQQLLEILTSFFDLDTKRVFQNYKKPILGAAAFGLGLALASQLEPGVLAILVAEGAKTPDRTIDILATALVISAGTEGVNSILKFLKYSKETKKREAAAADPEALALAAPSPREAEAAIAPVAAWAASEDSLARVNRQ
jgi:hypothetical protein